MSHRERSYFIIIMVQVSPITVMQTIKNKKIKLSSDLLGLCSWRRELGDTRCVVCTGLSRREELSVWNLRAVFDSPFPSPLSFFSA